MRLIKSNKDNIYWCAVTVHLPIMIRFPVKIFQIFRNFAFHGKFAIYFQLQDGTFVVLVSGNHKIKKTQLCKCECLFLQSCPSKNRLYFQSLYISQKARTITTFLKSAIQHSIFKAFQYRAFSHITFYCILQFKLSDFERVILKSCDKDKYTA